MNKAIAYILIACILTTMQSRGNQLVNADFEAGDTGFTTPYSYLVRGSTPGAEGTYFIGSDSKKWNGNFKTTVHDHTSGEGHMLMINGCIKGADAWSQNVNVVQGQTYVFRGWAAGLSNISCPCILIQIEDKTIGSLQTKPYEWNQFTCTWTAPHSGSVKVSIYDPNTAWLGNDFAIDDLSFASARPDDTAADKDAVEAGPTVVIADHSIASGNRAVTDRSHPRSNGTVLPPNGISLIKFAEPMNIDRCIEATSPTGTVVTAVIENIEPGPGDTCYWSNTDGVTATGSEFEFPLGVNESTIVFLTVVNRATGESMSAYKQVRVSDTTPPVIAILAPREGAAISGNALNLNVMIADLVDTNITDYIVSVGEMDYYPLRTDTGTGDGSVLIPANYIPESTDINVIAADASGNASYSTVKVLLQGN